MITNPLGYNNPTPMDQSKANRPMLSLETCLNLLRVFIPNADNCMQLMATNSLFDLCKTYIGVSHELR